MSVVDTCSDRVQHLEAEARTKRQAGNDNEPTDREYSDFELVRALHAVLAGAAGDPDKDTA